MLWYERGRLGKYFPKKKVNKFRAVNTQSKNETGMKRSGMGEEAQTERVSLNTGMSRTRHWVAVHAIPIITCDSLCDNFLFLSYDL